MPPLILFLTANSI